MHFSTLLGLLPLLSQLVLANTIDEICGGVDGIIDCKGSFDVPVKAKLKYCPQEVFEVCNRHISRLHGTLADIKSHRLTLARLKRRLNIHVQLGMTRLSCAMARPVCLVGKRCVVFGCP